MNVTGVVSCTASLSVLLVYLYSKEVNSKAYNSVIACVCLCDFFSCFGGALGMTKDGSFLCWVQAIATTYFPVAGVFWTTLVVRLTTTFCSHFVLLYSRIFPFEIGIYNPQNSSLNRKSTTFAEKYVYCLLASASAFSSFASHDEYLRKRWRRIRLVLHRRYTRLSEM